MSSYGYIEKNRIIAPVAMRSRFKGVGAWHLLTDEQRATHGWYPCVVIGEGYDTAKQVRSALPECVFDPAAKIITATYAVTDKPLETIQREAMDRAREIRKQRENAGTTLDGMALRTDSDSQNRVNGLVGTITTYPAMESFDFEYQPGEWMTVSREMGLAIGEKVTRHVQACFTNCRRLHEAIKAAASDDEVLAIDLEAGWPE